ncbi:MAG: glucose-6-phosphate isomerase [Bacteroidales bacterium]
MRHISLDIDNIRPFMGDGELGQMQKDMHYIHQLLLSRTGPGKEFLGWLDLPSETNEDMLISIEQDVRFLHSIAEYIVVIGIGGSYLGSKAVIEAISDPFHACGEDKKQPGIIYAGHHISEDYIHSLLNFLESRSYAIVVISKSGTTTEPAIAFRLLKNQLESKHGKSGARERIIAVTDKNKGALKKMADTEGYKSYIIPDDVGGRFSVLTPVGLLPIALAGGNIRQLIEGAGQMQEICNSSPLFEENQAVLYAAVRNILYRKGKPIEVLVNYEPSLIFLTEWWKQLFGESEGKQNKGIFPAGVNFTTDLHSMGQYLQDGLRVIFETVLSVEKSRHRVNVPEETQNLDGLNFLAGQSLGRINHMAEIGTTLAHIDGGVPVMKISVPEINEFYLGELIYFFEYACALSGYTLEVNPFDQPGVEAYKKNMFALLGKPGFEEETAAIRHRINW